MSSSARRRSLPVFFAIGLLALVLSACGGGKDSPSGASKPAVDDISGTYVVVQDSDGTKPKPGATVTLTLDKGGTLSVKAVSADDELTDTGTYSIHDGLMSILFKTRGSPRRTSRTSWTATRWRSR